MTGIAFKLLANGLLVTVRVTPNAAADRIEAIAQLDDGQAVLPVRVRAAPEDGKANAAVVKLIAAALDVPKSSVVVDSGVSARRKSVLVTGDGAALMAKAQRLATGLAKNPAKPPRKP